MLPGSVIQYSIWASVFLVCVDINSFLSVHYVDSTQIHVYSAVKYSEYSLLVCTDCNSRKFWSHDLVKFIWWFSSEYNELPSLDICDKERKYFGCDPHGNVNGWAKSADENFGTKCHSEEDFKTGSWKFVTITPNIFLTLLWHRSVIFANVIVTELRTFLFYSWI